MRNNHEVYGLFLMDLHFAPPNELCSPYLMNTNSFIRHIATLHTRSSIRNNGQIRFRNFVVLIPLLLFEMEWHVLALAIDHLFHFSFEFVEFFEFKTWLKQNTVNTTQWNISDVIIPANLYNYLLKLSQAILGHIRSNI